MSDQIQVNDKIIRIIGIQFFGLVIPNATGLVNNQHRSIAYLMMAYGFFILISFLIWQGNRFFLFRLQAKFNWFIHPLQKVVVLLAMNFLYTAPLVVGMLYAWYRLNGLEVKWQVIQLTTLVCVICVIFITHVYETVFLIKQRENDLIKSEQLQRAKVEAELEALKNQIDPHFMFNSLNSLTYLIKSNQNKAIEFTESLAEIYRYILSNKDETLVILEDEINFLNKYISLLGLRFENALSFNFRISKDEKSNFLIPPISIFIAVENVVKHNEISKARPLTVYLEFASQGLTILNSKVKKKSIIHSSGIGLKNLDERFRIITGKGIEIMNGPNEFKLFLPLLKFSG